MTNVLKFEWTYRGFRVTRSRGTYWARKGETLLGADTLEDMKARIDRWVAAAM